MTTIHSFSFNSHLSLSSRPYPYLEVQSSPTVVPGHMVEPDQLKLLDWCGAAVFERMAPKYSYLFDPYRLQVAFQ